MTAPNSETGYDKKIIENFSGSLGFFGATPVTQQTGDTLITTTGMNTGRVVETPVARRSDRRCGIPLQEPQGFLRLRYLHESRQDADGQR